MPTYVVTGYKPPEPLIGPGEKLRLSIYLNLKMDYGWPAPTRPYLVSAMRVPQRLGFNPASAEITGAGASDQNEATFLLSGLANNPTERVDSVVLLDGVPLREPFSGKVNLREIPPIGIGRTEELLGSGASAWGNQASAGVIQFFTKPALGRVRIVPTETIGGGPIKPKLTKQLIERNGEFSADLGSFGSSSVAFIANEPTSRGNLQLLGRYFYDRERSPVMENKRGPIDQSTSARGYSFQTRWRQPIGPDRELVLGWRSFREDTGAGTEMQSVEYSRDMLSFSITSARSPQWSWQTAGFVQRTTRDYGISAINMSRDTEFPLLDVRAADSTALGGSFVGAWRPGNNSRLVLGTDISITELKGEQLYLAEGRTVRGQEKLARSGVFALGDFELQEACHLFAGLRFDTSWEYARDVIAAAPAPELADRVSPTLGISWNASNHLRLHAQVQSGFRDPTFGDRFLRSGERATITLPNSLLESETSTLWQTGISYHPGAYRLSATLSRTNRIHTIAALVAAGPPDIITKQLANLGEVSSDQARLAAAWRQSDSIAAEFAVMFDHTDIGQTREYDGLIPAQTPKRMANLSVKWSPTIKYLFDFSVDYIGPRFADYENTQLLKSATIFSVHATYRWSERLEIIAGVRNVGNMELAADRGPHGVIYVAEPTKISVGVKSKW